MIIADRQLGPALPTRRIGGGSHFRRRVLPAAAIAGATAAVAIIGALITRPEIPTWYATLERPAFAPPNWLFGPVWSVLYLAMAFAMWLVWKQTRAFTRRAAATVYGAQLLLNLLWSVVFFQQHSMGGALIVIAALIVAIVALLRFFLPVSRTAVWLIVPYLLWVGFAAYLNFAFWNLNT